MWQIWDGPCRTLKKTAPWHFASPQWCHSCLGFADSLPAWLPACCTVKLHVALYAVVPLTQLYHLPPCLCGRASRQAVNVASTVVAIIFVDRLGRRFLFIQGGIQMILCEVSPKP